MNEHPVFLYTQVLSLIERYQLQTYPFKVGTAQGFADHLYSSHLFPLGVEEIAKEMRRYMREFRASDRHGRSHDAELERMRHFYLECAHVTDTARARVVDIIRRLVLSPDGPFAWNLIAQYATVPSSAYDKVTDTNAWPAGTVERVRETLTALLAAGSWLDDSHAGVNYSPGRCLEVDWMVWQDIERLHVTLATAPPAQERQPRGTYALHAVFRFARIVLGRTKSLGSEAGELPPRQLGGESTMDEPAAPASVAPMANCAVHELEQSGAHGTVSDLELTAAETRD